MIKEDLEKLLTEKEEIIAKEQKMLDAIKLLLSGFEPPSITMNITPENQIKPKELVDFILPRRGKNDVIGIVKRVLSENHDKWMTVDEILEDSFPYWKYPVNNKKDSIKKTLPIMLSKDLIKTSPAFTPIYQIKINQRDIDRVIDSIISLLNLKKGSALYPLTIFSHLRKDYCNIPNSNIFELELFIKLALENIKETNHPKVGYKKVDNEYQYWYKTPFLD